MNPCSSSYSPFTLLQRSPAVTSFESNAAKIIFRQSKIEGITENLNIFFSNLAIFCQQPYSIDWRTHLFNRHKRLRIAHCLIDLRLTAMDVHSIIKNALNRTQIEISKSGVPDNQNRWLMSILHHEAFRLHEQVKTRKIPPLPLFPPTIFSDTQ